MTWIIRIGYFVAGINFVGAFWDFHDGKTGHAAIDLFMVVVGLFSARVLEAHEALERLA